MSASRGGSGGTRRLFPNRRRRHRPAQSESQNSIRMMNDDDDPPFVTSDVGDVRSLDTTPFVTGPVTDSDDDYHDMQHHRVPDRSPPQSGGARTLVFSNAPFECPICFDPVKLATVPTCGHIFCEQCIKTCIDTGGLICPICRGSLQVLTRVYEVDKVVDAYLAALETGGPITAPRTSHPVTYQTRPVSALPSMTLQQHLKREWMLLAVNFDSGLVTGYVYIIRRITLFLRKIPWTLIAVTFTTGVVVGISVCRYNRMPEICPAAQCELRMSGWEHLVAAFRACKLFIIVYVAVWNSRFRKRTCRIRLRPRANAAGRSDPIASCSAHS